MSRAPAGLSLLFRPRKQPPAAIATEHAHTSGLPKVEAVLLLSGEPLSSRKLAQFAGLADGTEARTLVRRLNQLLDAAGSSFRVEEVAGGFQMLTRAKFGPWLRRFHQTAVQPRISASALETLAVVAYRQPVLRAEVEAVRGVQCAEMLRQLMERDLVRISGRSEDLGRPFLYGTTRRFLQVFGLRHLDELPRAAALRPRTTINTGGAPAAIHNPQAGIPLTPIPQTNETSSLTCSEERAVTSVAPLELTPEELFDRPTTWSIDKAQPRKVELTNEDEDDLEDDEEEEDEDDDDEEDDLEEDEWEEVEDEDDEEEKEEDDLDDEEEDDLEEDDDEDDDWDDDDDEDEDEDEKDEEK